eukprot:10148384-Heterocapsa_arctica.AAC.1
MPDVDVGDARIVPHRHGQPAPRDPVTDEIGLRTMLRKVADPDAVARHCLLRQIPGHTHARGNVGSGERAEMLQQCLDFMAH